jgi:hypothetical protein
LEGRNFAACDGWRQIFIASFTRWSYPNPPEKEVGRNAEHDKVGILKTNFLPMKKLVLIPILLFFALAMFFSCTKDAPTPNAETTPQSHILSMTKGEDGILNLTVAVEPAAGGAVADRDGCTMYEALRFKAWDCSNNPPEEGNTSVEVEEVKFRLIKIYKTSGARTAISDWVTADDVSGLNISWYNQSPLSDYWYATEIEDCGPAVNYPQFPSTCADFFICDFWSDDPYVQLDPWYCGSDTSIPPIPPNADAADFGFGPLLNDNEVIVVCNLGQGCAITGEIPLWFCL